MKKLLMVLAALMTFGLQAATVDPSGYIYLNENDPGGQYSFAENKGRWYENGTAITGAMPTDRDYLVQGASASSYRTLRVGGNVQFPGQSLTLDYGEIKASDGNPYTVGNLIVYYGRLTTAKGNGYIKTAGGIEIKSNGVLNFYGTCGRRLECAAPIVGDETTKIRLEAAEDTTAGTAIAIPYWAVMISGDNSSFKGAIETKCMWRYPTALIVKGDKALGAVCPMSFDSKAALLGNGGTVSGVRTISVGAEFVLGAYTTDGMIIGGGVTISGNGSSVISVTNCDNKAVTTFGNVSLAGVSKVVLKSGTTKFTSEYNNPTVPVEVMPGAKITSEEGANVGPVSSHEANSYITVVLPTLDVGALNRTNDGFSYPLLSAVSINSDDFWLYGGVTRESFVVRNSAQGVPTLYWERLADSDHGVVYLTHDQGNGQDDSFGTEKVESYGSNWSSGEYVKSANDYIVEKGQGLRNRHERTFAGHLLSILEGGELSLHANTTADAFQMFQSGRLMVRGTSECSFSGGILVRSAADSWVNVETENGKLDLVAALSGFGNVRYRGYNGQTDKTGTINVVGDNSGFTGKVSVPHKKMTVRFKNAAALGGNPRKFVSDGFLVGDGVTLQCDDEYAFGVTEPNRGVTLNGTVNFDVSVDQTCQILSKICGQGPVVKKDAGTLELGGENGFANGVTVQGGTLKLSHANAVGLGTLTVAGGALEIGSGVTVCVKGANPISSSGSIPLTIDAFQSERKWVPVFWFPDVESLSAEEVAAKFVVRKDGGNVPVKWKVDASDEGGVLVSARIQFGVILVVR